MRKEAGSVPGVEGFVNAVRAAGGRVVYISDQMGDFPAAGETFTGAGTDDQFGRSFFLLPNPMYGKWTNGVTRVSGSFP